MDKHRSEFEKWASDLLEMPVTIDKVNFSWYQYQPEITFNQVTLLSRDTKEPELQIQKVRVFFSIPRSLWQWKPVTSGIMIAGADINIRQSQTGEFTVQGFPSLGGFDEQPYKREAKFLDLLNTLSEQPRLILHDIDIRYTGFAGQKRFVSLYNLSFINDSTVHTILGKAVLHQDIPTETNIAVQWQGEKVDLAKIKAKIYIYVSGLSLSQWMKGFTWEDWQLNKGIGSAKIWATWKEGAFKKIQGTFQIYGLDLFSLTTKSSHQINRLSGNLGWRQDPTGQIFAGDDILLDMPDHLWPVTNFYVALNKSADGTLTPKAFNIGYLDLADLQKFIFAAKPLLAENIKKTLTKLQLTGSIQNTSATFTGAWNDLKHISLNANFNQIGFNALEQLPSIHHLTGLVKWNGTQGELDLNSENVLFQYDPVFVKPLVFDQITGSIIAKQTSQPLSEWTLAISSLRASNEDLAANIKGNFVIPQNSSPVADLSATFTMQNVNRISRYLPMKVFDPQGADWLRNAFVKGELVSGDAKLQGKLIDFPFDHGGGVFVVNGNVKNVDLHYAPDWPDIIKAKGRVVFSGRKMDVAVSKAELQNMPIKNIVGTIPYFGDDAPQILHVSSVDDIEADFSEAMAFVKNSPLNKTIGKMFDGVELHGPVRFKLGLVIPLHNPETAKVDGNIVFTNSKMDLVPWKLQLDHLTGALHFTEDAADAKDVKGMLFDKPFLLNINTVQAAQKKSIIQAKLAANVAMLDLEHWLAVPISKVATGSANVTGQFNFANNEPMQVHLESDLQGVAINLPDEFNKAAQDKRVLTTDIIAQEKSPLKMKFSYHDLLKGAVILDHKNNKFDLIAADLRLGKGIPEWPKSPGLYLSGDFDKLDWDKIKTYTSQSSGDFSAMTIPLKEIDVRANIISLAGMNFNQAHIRITPSKNSWNVDINSNEAIGQVKVPVNFNAKNTLEAQFQRLNLHIGKEKSTLPTIDVKSLPSISFQANNVSYNNMPLGQVMFRTTPDKDGLIIRSLKINTSRLDFQATGEWAQIDENYETHLQGKAISSNVSGFLNSLGLDVHNFESRKGVLTFNLTWNDAPYSPVLASMTGRASFDLGKGRILEVSQASGAKMDIGRMLSLFSLQSIPRRLSLDFSDVFQKGYSFDFIKGDFRFERGDAYTSNMRIDGPVARVDIYGRIGLARKDVDITMSVTPVAVAGLPVAAAIIGGATGPVGIAAVAVGGLLGTQISKASNYYYAVTGTWSNPTWTSISVPRRR